MDEVETFAVKTGLVTHVVETCDCLRCGSAIPNHHVDRRLLPAEPEHEAEQELLAYCEHCHTVYRQTRTLTGGVWAGLGTVGVLPEGRERRSFLNRIALLRGDRHQAAASPKSQPPTPKA